MAINHSTYNLIPLISGFFFFENEKSDIIKFFILKSDRLILKDSLFVCGFFFERNDLGVIQVACYFCWGSWFPYFESWRVSVSSN